MRAQETVSYLEMAHPGELRPALAPPRHVELTRVAAVDPELNRSLYAAVGAAWRWVDRREWTLEQWLAWLGRPGHETWVFSVEGVRAGYFELDQSGEGDVEIAYFGLLPPFVGQGLGGYLLSAAVRRAWQCGAQRVWLHTSSFDHPHALANYLARGFRLFKVETAIKELPDIA